MTQIRAGRGSRWLAAAAWIVIACSIAHLFGHFEGIAKVPANGPERSAVESMQGVVVPGPLLDPSLFGLLKGFSIFFSLACFVVGSAAIDLLRRADADSIRSARRLLFSFLLPGVIASASYFILPPTALLGAALSCAAIGTWRSRQR